MTATETVLYAIPAGETERYMEAIITTNPDAIEAATEWATAQGFHSFRTAVIDMTVAPDFAGSLNR